MSGSSAPPIQLDLSSTTGAYLIGVFFEVWLFGFTSLQSWFYFNHYPTDPKRFKALVIIIWTLEALHAALSCHAAYFWLAQNYLNPAALGISIWSADAALIVAGNLVFIVHCFFCYRVWLVSGRTYLMPAIIFVLALGSFGLDWGVFVLSVQEANFSGFGRAIQVVSSTALAFKVATDGTVAGSLAFFVHKTKTGVRSADHVANQLIFWAVNVGVLTSVFDVIVLGMSEGTSNLIYLAIYTIVGNLYSNSLLATLNMRRYERTQVLGEDGTAIPFDATMQEQSTTAFKGTSTDGAPQLPRDKGSFDEKQPVGESGDAKA